MKGNLSLLGSRLSTCALALAVGVMPCAAPMSALATETVPNANISIVRTSHNSATTYKAYQIFKGLVDAQDRIKQVEFASGFTSTDLVAKLNAIGATGSVPAPYDKWLTDNHKGTGTSGALTAADRQNPQNALEYISAAISASNAATNNTDTPARPVVDAGTFASEFAKWADDKATSQTITPGTALTTQEGYYLITTDASTIGTDGAGTAPIWTSVGGSVTSITEKVSVPTVNKQVKDDATGATFSNDAGKSEIANAEGYQDLDFKLTGTLPADYAAYSVYHYKFTDTLSNGLDMLSSSAASDPDHAGDISSVVVKVDGADVTGQLRSGDYAAGNTSTTGAKGSISYEDNKLIVDITDLKTVDKGSSSFASASSVITVEYKAHIKTGSATYGSTGNKNTVVLTYTNSPIPNGSGVYPDGNSTGEESKLVSYKLTINKIDSNNNVKLAGHKFVIKNQEDKYLAVDGSWTGDWAPTPASADGGNPASIGSSNLGAYSETVPAGKIGAQIATTDASGALTFNGLDEGVYTLHEVYAPNPYAALADVTVRITSNIADVAGDATGATAQTITASIVGTYVTMVQPSVTSDISSGIVTVTVPNDRMITVPITGEQGAMLLVLVGAAITLVSVAAKMRNRRKDAPAGAAAAA